MNNLELFFIKWYLEVSNQEYSGHNFNITNN